MLQVAGGAYKERRHAETRGSLGFQMRLCEPATSSVDEKDALIALKQKRSNQGWDDLMLGVAETGNLFDASDGR